MSDKDIIGRSRAVQAQSESEEISASGAVVVVPDAVETITFTQRALLLEGRRYTQVELQLIVHHSPHWERREPVVDWVELEGSFYKADLEYILKTTNWRGPEEAGMPRLVKKYKKKVRRLTFRDGDVEPFPKKHSPAAAAAAALARANAGAGAVAEAGLLEVSWWP
ncbi:hypothetical protein B484DRAFT_448385, partial [Ochromonadaceae sp. CCMP2298]